MFSITRRNALKSLGVAAAGTFSGAVGLSPSLVHAAVPKYTGTTYFTASYEDMLPPILSFVEKLKKHPDLMSIDFYDSGTFVKADEQVAALRSGTVQFMFHTTTYITRSFPILGVLGMPGIVSELYEHGDRLKMESPLWKLINDRLAKDNMFMLTAGGGVMEPEYIWSGSKSIKSLADMKGKRIRVVGAESEQIFKTYGAGATRIPSGEVYLAMQRGTVDAALLNLSTLIGRKLYEHVEYCYKLPMSSVAIAGFFLKSEWDKFPDKVKAAYWEAAKWYDDNDARIINTEFYDKRYWPQVKERGIKVTIPTESENKDFHSKCEPLWAEWKKTVGEDIGQKAINLSLGKS